MAMLGEIYDPTGIPADAITDADPEAYSEGDQLAGKFSIANQLIRQHMATMPNPARPYSLTENLRKMATSGDVYKKAGILPDLPPVVYTDSPINQSHFGLKTDVNVNDGRHRDQLLATVGGPIQGLRAEIFLKDGVPHAKTPSGLVYPVVVPNEVKSLNIQLPNVIVPHTEWGMPHQLKQAEALGQYATRDESFPSILQDLTKGGSYVEEGPLIHPDNAVDLMRDMRIEAASLDPSVKDFNGQLQLIAEQSNNPQLRWTAEEILKDPSLLENITPRSTRPHHVLRVKELEEVLRKALGDSYKPGYRFLGYDDPQVFQPL